MRYQIGVALSMVALFACQPPTDPTPPQPVTVTVTQIVGPNNSGNGSSTPGADAACAGITGNASLAFTGGLFSGGKAKVNEPLHAQIGGLTIPSSCVPVVSVDPSGPCSRLGTTQNPNDILVLPTAPGICTVSVCITNASPNRCAGNAVEVIA